MSPEAQPASMRIDLPGVNFAELARAVIAERLTEALAGTEDFARKVVMSAMETKVNDQGRVGQYSSENKIPYVEWIAGDLVRQATREVLQKKVEALRPVIEREVELALKKSAKTAAQALTAEFIRQCASGYHVEVAVAFKGERR